MIGDLRFNTEKVLEIDCDYDLDITCLDKDYARNKDKLDID